MGLPKTKFHHDSIFIVIDMLTKVTHFILGNSYDDDVIFVHKFMKEIFRLDGFPMRIISNYDDKFTLES